MVLLLITKNNLNNMKAEDKAKAIYYAMLNADKHGLCDKNLAKESALIAVSEINKMLWRLDPKVEEDYWLYREIHSAIPYWKDVENELKKLYIN